MATMNKCKYEEEMSVLMSLSLDGMLDRKEQQTLDDHLAVCESCQAEWLAMQQVSSLFSQSITVGPPYGFAIRVGRKLEEKTKRRRRLFGGMAVVTGSLSLAGMTVAAITVILLGVWLWPSLSANPGVQQTASTISQIASGLGLVGKGTSFFLRDILSRFGAPIILLLGAGLALLVGMWTWLFAKNPGNSRS